MSANAAISRRRFRATAIGPAAISSPAPGPSASSPLARQASRTQPGATASKRAKQACSKARRCPAAVARHASAAASRAVSALSISLVGVVQPYQYCEPASGWVIAAVMQRAPNGLACRRQGTAQPLSWQGPCVPGVTIRPGAISRRPGMHFRGQAFNDGVFWSQLHRLAEHDVAANPHRRDTTVVPPR